MGVTEGPPGEAQELFVSCSGPRVARGLHFQAAPVPVGGFERRNGVEVS